MVGFPHQSIQVTAAVQSIILAMIIIIDAITQAINHQLNFAAIFFLVANVIWIFTITVLAYTILYKTATAITPIPCTLKDIVAIITLIVAPASGEFTVFYH